MKTNCEKVEKYIVPYIFYFSFNKIKAFANVIKRITNQRIQISKNSELVTEKH